MPLISAISALRAIAISDPLGRGGQPWYIRPLLIGYPLLESAFNGIIE